MRPGRTMAAAAVCLATIVMGAVAMEPKGSVLRKGIDFWRTASGGSTYTSFGSDPIPAGFFCPGSQPFAGTIRFRGAPLATEPPNALQGADTVIERLDNAELDRRGMARTRVVVRALSLVSVSPVKTECGVFDVAASLDGEQPITEMEIRRGEHGGGGTFAAPLDMIVKLTFLARDPVGSQPRVLRQRIRFGSGSNSVWTRRPVKGALAELPTALRLDTDGDHRPETLVPGPSNFLAGWAPAAASSGPGACCVESCHCSEGSTDPNQACDGCQHFHCVWARVSCDFIPTGACVSGVEACPSGPMLSEVFYDASGPDGGLEWVELYNPSATSVDLSGFSLGNGGSSYTYSLVQLSGTVGPWQTFLVGGPASSSANGSPVFDQVVDFSPDFQNSGITGDGVALFDLPASQVTAVTVPIDAVVYGSNNFNGLIDETGVANAPEVGDASAGSSIERTTPGGIWRIQLSPTPNSTSF